MNGMMEEVAQPVVLSSAEGLGRRRARCSLPGSEWLMDSDTDGGDLAGVEEEEVLPGGGGGMASYPLLPPAVPAYVQGLWPLLCVPDVPQAHALLRVGG